jgi:glycosyltransferase involved in cell wall biosynthesis
MNERQVKFIYWFAYHNLYASSVRYRGKYPLDFAREKLGIGSYLVVPGYSPVRIFIFFRAYFSALFSLRKDALIVIQRVQSKFIYTGLLKILVKIRKRYSVYDLDDADYLNKDPRTIHYFARHCGHVSAGSREIAEYMMQFNRDVHHVTSSTPDLGIIKQKRNPLFIIGWIGSFGWGHKDSLYQDVFPVIKELDFPCKLTLVGLFHGEDIEEVNAYFSDCSNLELEIPTGLDWNNEADLQKRIAAFDVGIATLLNHPLQLSKSGIKAKQYLNNGVPVLSTNLPENNKVVQHGINGYLCDSPEDFKRGFIQFKTMPDDEYARFSRNARESIDNFNYLKYFEAFRNILNGKATHA